MSAQSPADRARELLASDAARMVWCVKFASSCDINEACDAVLSFWGERWPAPTAERAAADLANDLTEAMLEHMRALRAPAAEACGVCKERRERDGAIYQEELQLRVDAEGDRDAALAELDAARAELAETRADLERARAEAKKLATLARELCNAPYGIDRYAWAHKDLAKAADAVLGGAAGEAKALRFKVGDEVMHAEYGRGVVNLVNADRDGKRPFGCVFLSASSATSLSWCADRDLEPAPQRAEAPTLEWCEYDAGKRYVANHGNSIGQVVHTKDGHGIVPGWKWSVVTVESGSGLMFAEDAKARCRAAMGLDPAAEPSAAGEAKADPFPPPGWSRDHDCIGCAEHYVHAATGSWVSFGGNGPKNGKWEAMRVDMIVSRSCDSALEAMERAVPGSTKPAAEPSAKGGADV